MSESRTKNSMLNLVSSLVGQVLSLVLKFGVQTVFIYTLGKEFLGLNGLFTNILSFLSLAELGVGTAITFCLYKPIAENDEEKIGVLMQLFKRAYIVIGVVVLGVGAALTPFLEFFVSEMPPNIPNIHLIYLLFVLNSGISYFCAYKASFIIANQKGYIVTNNQYLFQTLAAILQVAILLIWKEYIGYLIVRVIFTLLENICINIMANRKYPVLKKKVSGQLDLETKNIIMSNIKAMFFHKIGATIVFSTDNILLSKMFGLGIVGLYSNYSLLITAVEAILTRFFQAITASIGNLGAISSKDKQNEIYDVVFFIQFWMYSFSAIAFSALFRPFITFWVGEDYLMDFLCTVFIVLNFYIKGMRQNNMMFNSAYGLARFYKWMPIPEVIINIVASILISLWIGPAGVFIGTTLSTLATAFWIEPRVLMKYGIQGSISKYWVNYIKYTLITAGLVVITLFFTNLVSATGLVGLVLKIIIVVIVPNLVILIMFIKSYEFNYLWSIVQRLITRKNK